MAIGLVAGSASAGSLLDKIKKGEPIRIGYSNDAPWAYSGSNNEPLGISNTIMLAVLKKMGAGKVELVSAEWGALIPGLQAGRFDLIADAMGVLLVLGGENARRRQIYARCEAFRHLSTPQANEQHKSRPVSGVQVRPNG
ncbi:transporter substrate-binding domain-containing protein [Mesorhizobium ciceri]|uniref:transporter substrate-binding domain-containing protein n=1 Tax=Mesorhizobium TaxID=68287 RepID=UPI001FD9E1EB|nr:transporter substrate-binding domain-containing protein [Mesorhizobium ciceri]